MRKYSIVVPIYNVQEYIEKCIESVLSQTYKEIELILVDDGSPDNSPNICDRYAQMDSRVKVIHKENGGLVSARQAGAMIATGDYIACLDGDDWLSTDYFMKIDQVLNHKQYDIVCFGYVEVYDTFEKAIKMSSVGEYSRLRIEKEIFPLLIENDKAKYYSPSIWAKIYKRELYVKHQLAVDPRIKIGEDHACTKPCIFEAESIFVMEDCLYYYRQNNTSMTKNKQPFDWQGPMLIGKHFEREIDMSYGDFQAQVYRSVVHNLFNVTVSQFNKKASYINIRKDIICNIKKTYYRKAIILSQYKGYKGRLVKLSLQYKCIFFIYIYNRYKSRISLRNVYKLGRKKFNLVLNIVRETIGNKVEI